MTDAGLSALNQQLVALGFGGGLVFGMTAWAIWNFLDWLMDKFLQRQEAQRDIKS